MTASSADGTARLRSRIDEIGYGAPPASRSTPSWLARRSPVKPGDPVGSILPFDNTGDSEIYHSDARLIEPVVFLEEEVTRIDITVNQPRPMTRGRPLTGGGATCGQRGPEVRGEQVSS